jgi:hypothetical protein
MPAPRSLARFNKRFTSHRTIRRIQEHRGRVFYEEWVGGLIADSGHRGLLHRGGCGGLVNGSASHKRSPLRFFVLVLPSRSQSG